MKETSMIKILKLQVLITLDTEKLNSLGEKPKGNKKKLKYALERKIKKTEDEIMKLIQNL